MPIFVFHKTKDTFSYRLAHMSRVMRKPTFRICQTAQLNSAFVFASWIVQSLYFLNPKFQASNHLLWLYSPVRVISGHKP